MSHTGIVRRKQDHNKQNWEENDFPILCESCLGDSPYMRMQKEAFGKECKTCTRPFTVFRWRSGPRSRYKKTEICNVCAKLKNVCQTCVLDLQFGLPSKILDQALPNSVQMPESEANREFFMDQAETMIALAQRERETTTPDQMLAHLTHNTPYYQHTQTKVCEFYLKGNCTRGKDCPYRHSTKEMNQGTSNQENGVQGNKLLPPQDTSITTLFIGGVKEPITEADIREKFFTYGNLENVTIIPKLQSAFITFKERSEAEAAVEGLFKKLKIRGIPLGLSWGSAQNALPPPPKQHMISGIQMVAPKPPRALPLLKPSPNTSTATAAESGNVFAMMGQYYPSMDPSAMGSKGDTFESTESDATE